MTPSPRRKAVSMAVAAGLLAFLAVVVSPAAAAAAAGASDARAREEGDRPWRGETQQHPQHVKAPCSLSTDGEGDLDGWLVPTEPCLVHRPPSREGATDTLPAECLKCVPRPHGLEEENSEGEREEGEEEGTFFSSGVGRSSGGGGSGGYGRGSRERQQGPRSFAPKGLDAERGWEGQFAEQALLEQRGSWQQQQQQQQQKERSSVSEREEGEGEVEEEEEEAAERGVGETGTEDADNNLEESMAVAVRNADGDDNGDAAGPGFGGAGAFAALVMAAAAAAASSVTSEALTGVTTALSSSASSSSAAGGEWEWGLDSGVADVDAGGRPDGEPDGGKSVGNPDGFPERFPQRSLDESPERLPDGSPAGRSDVRAEVRWASGTALRGGREATAAAGKGGGGGGGGGGGVARGVTTEERYGEDGRGVSRAMQEVTLAPTPSTIVDTPTPAPAALTTPAPVGLATPTPAPAAGITDAPEGAVTIEPTTEVTVVGATPAPSPVETLSPDETPAPSLTISPEELGSLVPTLLETLNPNGTLAPAAVNSTLSPLGVGETHAPTTFMPTLSPLGPGETHAPSITPAPGATREPSTSAPTEMFVDTPSPVANVTSTEEALETTADAATGAVAVGVAATAAVATVTTVTATTAATTAVTTTAATTTLTSTVTTVASSAATTTGGAGGVTTTGAGAAGSATSGVTATGGTTLTTATTTTTTQATSAGLPDVTSTARTTNVQGNIQTNATSGGVENSTAMGAADPGSISARAPSATLGLLMIFQMQFVSLLRMLEANITRPFMKFLDNMKWMNLHFEVDISFFNCDNEETRFDWANDDNGTWALNTFLVFALLGLLILVHILLVSYLEAAWLARANAIHRHRLDFVRRQAAEEETAPFDGRSAAAYAKYIDAKNQDRDLYEQEKLSTERYLRRHYSVWMYFPHVELLFLLLTYQGASAAEARLIYSGCFPLVVLGLCALIVFPLLMFIYVNRIVWSRLCTERSPVLFTPHENTRGGCCLFNACRGICGSWSTGSSMLAWADKGQWVSKNDETVDLDSRKFRIGFEPLFVDYTQRGTLYVTYLLFEWFAFGLIAGLVTNGTIQTSLICLIYTMDLVVLVCLQPFSNSIIQCVTTMTVLADALTLGLMVYASVLEPEDSGDKEKLDLIYTGALLIQTLTIIFFIVPLYLDAFITVVGTICAKAGQLLKGKEKKSKTLIRGSCDETMWIFFALVRENFIGCIKSTWKGPSYNPTANAQGVLRRRSTLLHPVDESASEEEVENPGFGKRPRRVKSAHAPTARRSHHMSTSNTLQDFSDSDHGPSERMEGGSLQRRGSANSSGGLSRGPSTYSRSSGSGRR